MPDRLVARKAVDQTGAFLAVRSGELALLGYLGNITGLGALGQDRCLLGLVWAGTQVTLVRLWRPSACRSTRRCPVLERLLVVVETACTAHTS